MRLSICLAVSLVLAACSAGQAELQTGDCVDLVGTGGGAEATERLVQVDCDSPSGDGIFRVVWIRDAADAEPVTVTRLAAECSGPTLLPDADMLQAGDRSVVCFESLG